MTNLLALHHRLRRTILKRFDCCQADAEDAASEAILVGIERGNFDLRYLTVCAKNYHRDRMRCVQRNVPMPVVRNDSGDEHPAEFVLTTAPSQELTMVAVEIIDAIYDLPVKQRDIALLLAAGCTPTEIKDEIGVSEKNFDYRVGAARKTLRALDAYDAREKIGGHRKYVGITPYFRKWQAKMKVAGKTVYIGLYKTPFEAAKAYDIKARELLGGNARLNFPDAA